MSPAEADQARFENRATAGKLHLGLTGCSGPVGTEPSPRRYVDGLARLLHGYEEEIRAVQKELREARKDLADTRERLGRVERLLSEAWGKK